MDVSQLSVSIEVDMSGFIEAMEKVSATLIATADLFKKVSDSIGESFSGMGKSSEEGQSSFGHFVELGKNSFEIFKILKELLGNVGISMLGVGTAGEEAGSAIGLLGTEASLGPLGLIAAAVTAIGLAFAMTSKSTTEATKTVKEYQASADKISFKSSTNILDGLDKKKYQDRADATASDTPDSHQDNNFMAVRPINDETQTDSTTDKKEPDSNKLSAEFDDDYKSILAHLKELNPPDKANIKVEVSVTDKKDSSGKANGPSASNNGMELPKLQMPTDAVNELDARLQVVTDHAKAFGETKMDTLKDELKTVSALAEGAFKSGDTVALDTYKKKLAELTRQEEEAADTAKMQAAGQKLATDMIADSAKGIGDSIAAMALGEKSNPLAAIMSSLAGALSAYAMILITTGTSMLLTGDPAGGAKLAEGTGLEAVAGIIKGLSAKKFATGGIVSGSTFANIGEYAGASHNPEVVAPLDKLRGMLGGGGNNMHYSFEMMGDKMVAALDRQSNNNNFVLGTNNQ